MQHLKIDIVSDIACPWCAIGYARLEQAMQQMAQDAAFSIQWHAFELNPDHGSKGEPILPALARKYGRSEDEMRTAQSDMTRIATELGLNFEMMQQRYTCNTFDAHRLVKWADDQGKATEMKMALFEAYFGRADDVSKQDVLLRCVTEAGLDEAGGRAVLESDEFAQVVRDDEATYQRAGVSAVPAFIINDKYLISGAQEPETLVQAFREIGADSE